MRSRRRLVLLLGLAIVAQAGAQQERAQQAVRRQQGETLRVSATIDGSAIEIVTRVFKPEGAGPFPFVLYAHGRAGSAVERAAQANPIGSAHVHYWLSKGVAVIAPIRPGYGATGGADREEPFSRWSGNQCLGNPDFTRTSGNARAALLATLEWTRAQPWARPDRGLIEGQSVGGMSTIALAALNPPGVLGAVNFAGGSGGNPTASPGRSCKPGNLQATYTAYGREVRMPSLWLYASNDQYWGPDVPVQWHAAFAAGGSDTELLLTEAVAGADGHQLVNRGPDLWRAALDGFVKKVGLLAP
ncbi:MAG: dipeptidyl aminopeptidase [Variovorax sp.]|nr:MAG: dipeptidyl aminopeptidase [Variovorax sp.]